MTYNCKKCKDTGSVEYAYQDQYGNFDLYLEICDCELDRKDFIHDVCEAAPKSGYCSKEGVVLPE
jgi:hypothetical protein